MGLIAPGIISFKNRKDEPVEIIDVRHLDDICEVLRRYGVHSARVGDLELTFDAPATAGSWHVLSSPPPEPELKAETEPPAHTDADAGPAHTCPCGHPYYQHSGDTGCLDGCDLRACVPTEPKETI